LVSSKAPSTTIYESEVLARWSILILMVCRWRRQRRRTEEEMMRAIENSERFLPVQKPRYAMGLGTPPQIIEMVARGIDMFDLFLPPA